MGKIKTVNKSSGEVREFTYKNVEDLRDIYETLSSEKKSLEQALAKVNDEIAKLIPDEGYEFRDGVKVKTVQSARYTYPKDVVSKYLDPDQFDLVTEVNGTKLKDLLKELTERKELEPGAWKDILEQSEVKYTKPYVRFIR